MKLKTRISMHSALTTETPEFFFICYASIIGFYPCTVVRYHTVRYRTVRYCTRSQICHVVGFQQVTKVNPSCYHKQTYCTVHYSICQVDFPYGTVHYLFCFMRPVVVFYHYPWNNQVFYYGTVPYITLLYDTIP